MYKFIFEPTGGDSNYTMVSFDDNEKNQDDIPVCKNEEGCEIINSVLNNPNIIDFREEPQDEIKLFIETPISIIKKIEYRRDLLNHLKYKIYKILGRPKFLNILWYK